MLINFEKKKVNTFWSTFLYNVEEINEIVQFYSLQFNKFGAIFLKNWRHMHFLKMIILSGKLIRFITYGIMPIADIMKRGNCTIFTFPWIRVKKIVRLLNNIVVIDKKNISFI